MALRLTLAGLALAALARAAEPPGIGIGEEIALARSEHGNQRGAAVCATPDGYLVAWQEGWPGEGGTCVVHGCFVKDGKPEKSYWIPRKVKDKLIQESPAAAFGAKAGKALVVWQELVEGKQYDVRARFISFRELNVGPDTVLRVAGEPDLAIAATAHNEIRPAVATDGENFLVAWAEYSAGEQSYAPVCARVSAAGKVLDKPIQLSKSGGAVAACFNGQDYVVVYGKGKATYAKRVSREGKLLDTDGIKPSGLMGEAPSVASDGKDAMVLASAVPAPDPWGWGGPACVVAGRVTRDGGNPERELNKKFGRDPIANGEIPNVLDHVTWRGRKGWPAGAPGGFRGTGNGMWPTTPGAITFAGSAYLAVWPRAHLAGQTNLSNHDLYAVRVSREPVKGLGEPVPVAAGGRTETAPALASAKAGECLLVYEAVQEDGSVALHARLLKLE